MDSKFIQLLKDKAKNNRSRIGIGIWKGDAKLISTLQSASEYANLVLVGDTPPQKNFDCIQSNYPWETLSKLLAEGDIDGAVRGNLPASKTMKALANRFDIKIRRLALIELPGWAFFLGPVGIDEGDTISDKLALIFEGVNYLGKIGISSKVSILSGGRIEDIGRSERIDRSLAEGEFVAARALDAGVKARHKGILIEECWGDDLVLAPDGISGNLIFRTLLLICQANSLGAPVLMDNVFVDSTRARSNFVGPIILASAMASLK